MRIKKFLGNAAGLTMVALALGAFAFMMSTIGTTPHP